MKAKFPLLLALTLGLTASPLAQAVDLVGVYRQALDYDSELAAARASYQAQEEQVYEARAGLLPRLSAGASAAHVQQDGSGSRRDSYRSLGYSLTLSQPLFRADTWYQYQGSRFASQQAEAEFVQEQQSLMLRSADAYFSVLRARENLVTSKAAEQAFERQWEQARERFQVGLIAITEVQEARALYDAARVQRIAAEGELAVALESLERLTGQPHRALNRLSADFPILSPDPEDPEAWVRTALEQNPAIRAARHAVEAARERFKASRALYYPTLDAIAQYSDQDIDGNGNNLAQTNGRRNNLSIGLELNLPLYTGGGTQAGVRRTGFQLEQFEQILTTTQRNVTLNTRSLLRNIKTGIQSIDARRQAIVSAESALEATRAGYEVGTRNIVEVLEAERLYYETLRDYANERFTYVLNSLRLKQAAGTLSPGDLELLNRWLVEEVRLEL